MGVHGGNGKTGYQLVRRFLVEGFSGLSLVFQSHWSLVTYIHSAFVISLSDSFLKFNDSEQGLP